MTIFKPSMVWAINLANKITEDVPQATFKGLINTT